MATKKQLAEAQKVIDEHNEQLRKTQVKNWIKEGKCPFCGSDLVKDKEDGHCNGCYKYKIGEKWMTVACDEYHAHSNDCLIEVKPRL